MRFQGVFRGISRGFRSLRESQECFKGLPVAFTPEITLNPLFRVVSRVVIGDLKKFLEVFQRASLEDFLRRFRVSVSRCGESFSDGGGFQRCFRRSQGISGVSEVFQKDASATFHAVSGAFQSVPVAFQSVSGGFRMVLKCVSELFSGFRGLVLRGNSVASKEFQWQFGCFRVLKVASGCFLMYSEVFASFRRFSGTFMGG